MTQKSFDALAQYYVISYIITLCENYLDSENFFIIVILFDIGCRYNFIYCIFIFAIHLKSQIKAKYRRIFTPRRGTRGRLKSN